MIQKQGPNPGKTQEELVIQTVISRLSIQKKEWSGVQISFATIPAGATGTLF
jgi:hypothetical protein